MNVMIGIPISGISGEITLAVAALSLGPGDYWYFWSYLTAVFVIALAIAYTFDRSGNQPMIQTDLPRTSAEETY